MHLQIRLKLVVLEDTYSHAVFRTGHQVLHPYSKHAAQLLNGAHGGVIMSLYVLNILITDIGTCLVTAPHTQTDLPYQDRITSVAAPLLCVCVPFFLLVFLVTEGWIYPFISSE